MRAGWRSLWFSCGPLLLLSACREWSFEEPSDAATSRDASVDGSSADDARVDARDAPMDAHIDRTDSAIPDAPTRDVRLDTLDPPDAASRDAFSCGAFSCTCTPEALFCEDFEGAVRGVWMSMGGGESLVASPTSTGARAMRVHVDPGGSSRGVGSFEPVTSGEFWTRLSVYVPSAAVVDGVSPMLVGQSTSPFAHAGLSIVGSDAEFGVDADFAGIALYGPALQTVRRNAWECLELQVVVHASAGAMRIYRNGTLAVAQTGRDTTLLGGYGSVSYGIAFSRGTQPAIDLYVDNIVVSRTRIPCP